MELLNGFYRTSCTLTNFLERWKFYLWWNYYTIDRYLKYMVIDSWNYLWQTHIKDEWWTWIMEVWLLNEMVLWPVWFSPPRFMQWNIITSVVVKVTALGHNLHTKVEFSCIGVHPHKRPKELHHFFLHVRTQTTLSRSRKKVTRQNLLALLLDCQVSSTVKRNLFYLWDFFN